MLVPVCKECYEKIINQRKHIATSPCQGSDVSVKEYFESFKQYLSDVSIPINSILAKELFIDGLSEENKKEVYRLLRFNDRPVDATYIMDLVCYLSSLEDFRDTIFGKKDELEPLDIS